MNNPNEVRCERDRLLSVFKNGNEDEVLLAVSQIGESVLESDAKRIAELEGCVAALRKDAERYRYARGRLSIGEQIVGWDKEPRFVQWSDADIDAALNRPGEASSASDTPMAGKEKA